MASNNPHYGYLEDFDPNLTVNPDDYVEYVGKEKIEEIKKLAAPLNGKMWTNLNSTLIGGGVAEMLHSMVPLARGFGIDAHWHAIRGNQLFFETTKKFHDMLQGLNIPISMEEIFGAYLKTVEENASHISIESDLIVVHDPQPLALIGSGVLYGNVLWRCHIDTSKPHKNLWRFVLPYINQYAGAIFTMPEFVGQGLNIPVYEAAPCIDPRAEKNKQYTEDEANTILEPIFKENDIDANRPIFAAISRYDVHKNQESILIAFNKLRQEKQLKTNPMLIFMGNTASDDPEGGKVLERLKQKAGDDPDIKFLVNVKNNNQAVGALMKKAKGFVHVSTKEGFGLVVAEALWQGTPVIGSAIGGIKIQIKDGNNGFLVDPLDAEIIAEKMSWLLENPKEAEEMGKRGIEHVRNNFLLPELIRKYFTLFQHYIKTNGKNPSFRLNQTSYSEKLNAIRNKLNNNR